jgi:hypothetical protein
MAWRFDFFPVADAEALTYQVTGEVLSVNGETYDFSTLPEGESWLREDIPGSGAWLRSTEVTRWEGTLRLCVVMPFDSAIEPLLPRHVRHPDGVTIEQDGRVPLPTD